MLRFLSQIAQSLSPMQSLPQEAPVNDVAYQLLERAGARAGRDPQAAAELRNAANAYLRVVR